MPLVEGGEVLNGGGELLNGDGEVLNDEGGEVVNEEGGELLNDEGEEVVNDVSHAVEGDGILGTANGRFGSFQRTIGEVEVGKGTGNSQRRRVREDVDSNGFFADGEYPRSHRKVTRPFGNWLRFGEVGEGEV